FFGGLTAFENGRGFLTVFEGTVLRDWRLARIWIVRQNQKISRRPPPASSPAATGPHARQHAAADELVASANIEYDEFRHQTGDGCRSRGLSYGVSTGARLRRCLGLRGMPPPGGRRIRTLRNGAFLRHGAGRNASRTNAARTVSPQPHGA